MMASGVGGKRVDIWEVAYDPTVKSARIKACRVLSKKLKAVYGKPPYEPPRASDVFAKIKFAKTKQYPHFIALEWFDVLRHETRGLVRAFISQAN